MGLEVVNSKLSPNVNFRLPSCFLLPVEIHTNLTSANRMALLAKVWRKYKY